nr:uncharacterized protein LOC119167535 isoform X2 [Rhipicephalus microplus]
MDKSVQVRLQASHKESQANEEKILSTIATQTEPQAVRSGMQAYAKFKNQKDTFTKHKNRIKGSIESDAGAGDVPNVKWVHFEAMMSMMGPIHKEPIVSTNVGFINPDRASGERSPALASNSSSCNTEESQVDHDSYVAVILDEPLDKPASSSGATPANTETDRSDSAEGEQDTRKQAERSSKTLCYVDIASECLHQLRAIKAAQEQHDLPYFFGMSLVQQLRLLNPHQQVDAITALQKVMQKKISEAKLELAFGN